MKYLCLVYCDEGLLHSLPDSPEDAECMAYAEAVHGSGRMLAAEALKPVQTATTVRVRNGHMSLTDGPFAETKEQLAGFYLVEARDLNEALNIAKGIRRHGSAVSRCDQCANCNPDSYGEPSA